MRLLDAQQEQVEGLRREIMTGVEDIQQGRFTAYATDAELDEFADQVIQQGREGQNRAGKM